jgi:uncharacterized protein (DUF58 family)
MSTRRTTGRWRGVVAVALFAGAIGVFAKRPDVLLCAVVGVAFAVYPQVTSGPTVDVEVDRAVSDRAPTHDEPTEVTVTVRNAGESTLPDVRIVDGVPPMLPVSGGSARHATALRPGETTRFSYELTARHGTHSFGETTVIARDVSGMRERETTVSADAEIDCHAAVPVVPLRAQTGRRPGRIATDSGGSGIEFDRTRTYRAGDPLNRIDWRRYARTGTLTTVEFREERAASVVVCVDARPPAYRAREGEPHAVSHGVAAAREICAALSETHDRAGLAAFGRDFLWEAPGMGAEHDARLRRVLATHPTLSPRPPDGSGSRSGSRGRSRSPSSPLFGPLVPETLDPLAGTLESLSLPRESPTARPGIADGGESKATEQTAELRRRLDGETQVLLLSPLLDDDVVEAALTLEAGGNAVTVVSPDVTTAETVGGRLARTRRANRSHSLQRAGVPVVDWDTAESLGAALLRAAERRSR